MDLFTHCISFLNCCINDSSCVSSHKPNNNNIHPFYGIKPECQKALRTNGLSSEIKPISKVEILKKIFLTVC